MNEKEYQAATTKAAWMKRDLDVMSTDLIAKTQALDPNQALMVMALIGHRLLEAQSIRQARGLAKYANLKSEGAIARSKNLQLARGLRPEEVVFGSNVTAVSDLLKEVRPNDIGRASNSPEEEYTKQLTDYAQLMKELHAYENQQGLDQTAFAMKPTPSAKGQPPKKPIERIEKEIGDLFSRIKFDFAKRPSVPSHMGRPGKDVMKEWWEANAVKVVELRRIVLSMDDDISGDADVTARAHKLNLKIAQVARAMISNKPTELPRPVVINIEYHIARAEASNRILAGLLKKIDKGIDLSEAESKQTLTLMRAASEQRYQFYIDDVKARFPAPFKDPVIQKILNPFEVSSTSPHSSGLEP